MGVMSKKIATKFVTFRFPVFVTDFLQKFAVFLIIHFLRIAEQICHGNLSSTVWVLVHASFCNMRLEARRSSRKVREILIGEIKGEEEKKPSGIRLPHENPP